MPVQPRLVKARKDRKEKQSEQSLARTERHPLVYPYVFQARPVRKQINRRTRGVYEYGGKRKNRRQEQEHEAGAGAGRTAVAEPQFAY